MAGSMARKDSRRRGTRLSRPLLLACVLALGAPLSGVARAQNADFGRPALGDVLRSDMADRSSADLRPFYAARGWRPLWLSPDGSVRPAAISLLRQLETARMDGLNPRKLKAGDLRKALDRARNGDPENLARLELTASRIYVGWVKALRGAPHAAMIYETEALSPVVPTTMSALGAAASARSLDAHLETMGWMHPLYAPLREGLLDHGFTDAQRRLLVVNLERVRALPAITSGRHVLVDAAGARLWMYEDGKPVDSMNVVVGKADNQTPMMAGFMRYAILNPYWNVPEDLVASRIAANVLDKGTGYLKASGYQVLDGWEDGASKVDPETVDWVAVASGLQQVRVRQMPGGSNFMGRVKFMFPNAQGIYLHDTPDKDLMRKDGRQYSSGCVRLEDASKFGRWLLGKPLPRKVSSPEFKVALPAMVPIFITYLTAFPQQAPTGTTIVFRADPYGRDYAQSRLARADSDRIAAR